MYGKIRGRFAPSPTGEMHLGNAWTALLAWLQVRSAGGTMVLRVEDLDPDRSRPEYTAALLDDLKWLGLDWDEGPDLGGPYKPYSQNERRCLYDQALNKLTMLGYTYPCYCTRAELSASAPHAGDNSHRYPGTCRYGVEKDCSSRRPSLRLKVPTCILSFEDDHLGYIEQNISDVVGDFVVRRSDGVHAYQLAVVVDDAAMRITNVLRGDDLLDSTPRQLLLYKLLELTPPSFAHVPLLFGEDGHRLSKRQRALSIAALRRRGVKAESIVGYLAWKAGLIEYNEAVDASSLLRCFSLERLPREKVVVEEDYFEKV